MVEIDWVEAKTASLLRIAKRSGYFKDAVDDAKEIAKEGYTWDVALAKACAYWAQ